MPSERVQTVTNKQTPKKYPRRRYMRTCALSLFLVFLTGGCGKNDLSKNEQPSQTAAVADVEDIRATQKAEQVAETVRQKAQVSEKAEGSQDLVKDKVSVKKTAKGEPVIEQTGEASSYGQQFQGKTTAAGEKFDKNDLTAAHPTLPLGTKAKVTNLKTGKSVDVRINDRGPHVKGRDIDVSQGAAKKLDMIKSGTAPVKIEAKLPSSKTSTGSGSTSASEEPVRDSK
jgi:rare lipoprotein A (peptidoglycan hydrolase)